MKQKLLMMLAALMLMGTSAMAQSETLKGDVNGDGAVDVADIAAVIQIMKDNGDIETKYYWYVGQENPANLDKSFNPGDNIAADYISGGGWYLLGDAVPETIQQLVKGGDANKYWYVAIPITTPTTLKPVATDMTTLDTTAQAQTIKLFNNVKYQVYWYSGGAGARNTFRFAKK